MCTPAGGYFKSLEWLKDINVQRIQFSHSETVHTCICLTVKVSGLTEVWLSWEVIRDYLTKYGYKS